MARLDRRRTGRGDRCLFGDGQLRHSGDDRNPELAPQGFPLIGGRLDSIGGKTVAAIVYKRRLHTVNLYVWPEKDSSDQAIVKDGFAIREWSHNGLRFAAVSDIPAAELHQFQALFLRASS